jgi:hypothetical protein
MLEDSKVMTEVVVEETTIAAEKEESEVKDLAVEATSAGVPKIEEEELGALENIHQDTEEDEQVAPEATVLTAEDLVVEEDLLPVEASTEATATPVVEAKAEPEAMELKDSASDTLQDKYASIDSLEERAYQIVMDLGMLENDENEN